MSDLVIPAPIIRRLAAAVYDSLLALALIIVSLLIALIPLFLLHIDAASAQWARFCTALELSVGLLFFGWFWTHGGQTAGMVAWRLQVRRDDGAPLRWPIAAIRYAAMIACWITALAPTLIVLPQRISGNNHLALGIGALALTVLGLLSTVLDGRKRAPHDRVSGCEVILLPPKKREA